MRKEQAVPVHVPFINPQQAQLSMSHHPAVSGCSQVGPAWALQSLLNASGDGAESPEASSDGAKGEERLKT